MSRAFYHENPDLLTFATEIVDAQPGRVRLHSRPFFRAAAASSRTRG